MKYELKYVVIVCKTQYILFYQMVKQILGQFTTLLERLVLSNVSIIANRTLELVVQIVRQPPWA